MPEKEVVKRCLRWLIKHNIFANRHDVGAGVLGQKGYATYGIKDGGDIIGLLPNGQHLEIECKRGRGGRLSAGQQQRQRKIIENHGLYLIVHGISELEYYLERR